MFWGKITKTMFCFKSKVKGIKVKIIMSFFIPVLLMIIMGSITYTKSSDEMKSTYESTTLNSLTLASDYFNVVINKMSDKALQLVADESLVRYFSGYYKDKKSEESQIQSEVSKRISVAALSDDFISRIYVLSENQRGIMSNQKAVLPDIYEELKNSEEIKLFQSSGQNYYYLSSHKCIDDNVGIDKNEYSLSYIININNSNYKQVGYIIVDLKYESVEKILRQLVTDKNTIVGFIAGNQREIIQGNDLDNFSFETQEFYRTALKSDKSEGYDYVQYKGKSYLFTYSKIENTNIMICSLIPKETILKQSADVMKVTGAMVIFASIIAIIIGTKIAYGISTIIHKANDTLERAGDGDLTIYINTKRKDEFQVLTKSITNMIISVKNIIMKLTGITKTVFHSSKEVSGNSEILLKATQEIALAVEGIEQGIMQQSKDAENCLVKMEDLSEQISNVYKTTNEIELIADDTKKIVSDSRTIVHDLNQKAESTAGITCTIIDEISSLEAESNKISMIAKSITDISITTNLLSLNAAIEAARAGEAGKGFAVVAEEIRKLAVQSSDSVDQIGKIIAHIQEKTRQTVITAKQAEEIVNSQTLVFSKTVQVFDDINKLVEKLTHNLTHISNGISSMKLAKEDTLSSIESISAMSEQTSATTINLSEIANNQLKAVKALNQVATELEENACSLDESIKIFKT